MSDTLKLVDSLIELFVEKVADKVVARLNQKQNNPAPTTPVEGVNRRSEAAKKRWAARKAANAVKTVAKVVAKSNKPATGKKGRVMTEAWRQKIAAGAKARWAKRKANSAAAGATTTTASTSSQEEG